MDLEQTPWADTAGSSQPAPDEPTTQSIDLPISHASAQSSGLSGSGVGGSGSLRALRSTPRRLVAHSTRLEAVDDPLGPLGPLGGGDGPAGVDMDSSIPSPGPVTETGPIPPQKEGLPRRTTLPPSLQPARRTGPADPHQIDPDDSNDNDDNTGRLSGPRVPPPVLAALPSPIMSPVPPSVSIEQASKPSFQITVGDPAKVGDLTSSHIVYTVRTKTTSKAYRQSEFEVKRRYRDFLWLYNVLHTNCPGVVVPPPPEKLAVGRFETNFIEGRRAALEKMLNKMAAHNMLQQDVDLKLFLESEAFNVDVKHKDRREPSLPENKSVLGTLGINVGGSAKFIEQDDWFHDRKVYLDALENQLKALLKSMETMVAQRKMMAESAGDFSTSLRALSTVEVSPSLSGPLDALSELQLRIREVYERQAQQDVLTLGIVIDEYIRLISSVKQAFGQRQKAFFGWHAAEAELQKRKYMQEKLLRQGRSQTDRLSVMGSEVAESERKVQQARLLYEDMGRLMHAELNRFEREKVEDFKSAVETFLESAVEAQKELIEKWETFLMQLDAEDDESVFYRPPVYQDPSKPLGDTAVDRARAKIHEDSD